MRAKGPRLVLKKVLKSSAGSVSVRAIASQREGRTATKKFKATSKLPTRLKKLPLP